MYAFSLKDEQEFDPKHHVEKILGKDGEGDFTVACWEPGQVSPDHCHPDATEIYFCFEGGGTMKTAEGITAIKPGAFVVHPPGEVHEYTNGPERTLLFRVRYGSEMAPRMIGWPTNPEWQATPADIEYFENNPVG
jgi:quercetin dioxygenase-like cupin family protein